MSYRPSFSHPLLGSLALALASWFLWDSASAQDRLRVEAAINGKPVRLAFDTGAAPYLVLSSKAAIRLGLSVTNAPKDALVGPGEVPMGWTEPFHLRIRNRTFRVNSRVFEIPKELPNDFDGVLGWASVNDAVLAIDALQGQVIFPTNIPPEAADWVKFTLKTNAWILMMEVPNRRGEPSVVLVDTGSFGGIELAPSGWRDWKAAHTNQPTTLNAYYTPGSGLVAVEVAWARTFAFGPLVLTDVPITEASETDVSAGSANYQATLGMAALKRLDFIVDRKKGVAYLHPKDTPPPDYEHNRLGAVFTPVDLQSDDLIGHVVDGSPAWEAGIRNGDVLTRIDELDVTKWRTDPAVLPLSRFWERPPGTKLQLTLKRGNEVFNADVMLRQILGPETNSTSKLPK